MLCGFQSIPGVAPRIIVFSLDQGVVFKIASRGSHGSPGFPEVLEFPVLWKGVDSKVSLRSLLSSRGFPEILTVTVFLKYFEWAQFQFKDAILWFLWFSLFPVRFCKLSPFKTTPSGTPILHGSGREMQHCKSCSEKIEQFWRVVRLSSKFTSLRKLLQGPPTHRVPNPPPGNKRKIPKP